jgi:hypothetical protein
VSGEWASERTRIISAELLNCSFFLSFFLYSKENISGKLCVI